MKYMLICITAGVIGGIFAALMSLMGYGIDTWEYWIVGLPFCFLLGMGIADFGKRYFYNG